MKSIAILFFALVGLAACENWAVRDSLTKEYCIILQAETVLNMVYQAENGTETCKVDIKNAQATGNCTALREGKEAQYISVTFNSGQEEKDRDWILDIWYTNTTNGFQISDYSVTTTESSLCPHLEPAVYRMLKNSTNEVSATASNGFQCSKSALPLENGSSVQFKTLRTVAFAHLNTTDFPASLKFDLCFLDTRTSDIVPIIVGACLACLVIIVLVAYLIGRARARRQGYASV